MQVSVCIFNVCLRTGRYWNWTALRLIVGHAFRLFWFAMELAVFNREKAMPMMAQMKAS